MQKPISEQVIVIIGASSGIGRSTALLVASKGAKVVAVAKSELGLKTLVEEIKERKGESTFVVGDISRKKDAEKVVQESIKQFGRIDTWVHVAGILMHAKFEDSTEDDWRRILEVNVIGVANGIQATLPQMKKYGGTIIVVGSAEGKRTIPLNSAYGASKHAITGMLQALRVELMSEGAPVTITEVLPGTVHSPIYDKQRVKMQGDIRYVGPQPRYHPDVIARSILYAATHKVRDLPSGTTAYLTWWLECLSPRLFDYLLVLLLKSHLQCQGEVKPAGDNFYKAMEGPKFDRVTGDFPGPVVNTSLYNMIREASPLETLYSYLTSWFQYLVPSPPKK